MTYSAEVLADSPLVYWRLGESSGTTLADSSGNGRNATLVSGTLGTTGLLTGDSDTAVTNINAEIADAAWMDTTNITVECWVKYNGNSYGGDQTTVARYGSEGFTWNHRRESSAHKMRVQFANCAVDSTTALNNGTRYHVVTTYSSSGTLRLYINGVEEATGTGDALSDSGRKITMGRYSDSEYTGIDGVLDEVAIYGSVLSADRIAAHYNAGIGVTGPVSGGTAHETDMAKAGTTFAGPVSVSGGTGHETDSAHAGTVDTSTRITGGTAHETDTAASGTVVGGETPGEPPLPPKNTAGFGFDIGGTLTIDATPPPVVDDRVSHQLNAWSIPAPELTDGRPDVDDLTNTLTWATADWGYERLLVGGKDVTLFRDLPFVLEEQQNQVPMGSSTASYTLPGLTYWELNQWRDGTLPWMGTGKKVVHQRVQGGVVVETLWRGFVIAPRPAENGVGVTLECSGHGVGRLAAAVKTTRPFPKRKDAGRLLYDLARNEGDLVIVPTLGINTGKILDERSVSGGSRLDAMADVAAKGMADDGRNLVVMPIAPRRDRYRMGYLDTTTVHATVFLGSYGVKPRLNPDLMEEITTVYGMLRRPDGGLVANFRAPNLVQGEIPDFPGTLSEGDEGEAVTALQERLFGQGYMTRREAIGGFNGATVDAVEEVQDKAGLAVTGVVNEATWRALFDLDITGRSTTQSHMAPWAQASRVKKSNRSATGAYLGRHDGYDRDAIDVQVFYDWGVWERTPAKKFSRNQIHHDDDQIEWAGQLVLEGVDLFPGDYHHGDPLDPEDLISCRTPMAGWNIMLRYWDGTGRLLHVANDQKTTAGATLDCGTKARPALEMAQRLDRDRESKRNPGRAWMRQHRGLDQVGIGEWPAELAGKIDSRIWCPADQWTMFYVPVGDMGTIAQIREELSVATEFATIVLAKPGSNRWANRNIGNPFANKFKGERISRLIDDERVLLYSAGITDAPGGYGPNGSKDDGDPVTGILLDAAGFPYRSFPDGREDSASKGLLWVGIYPKASAYLRRGRIFWPGTEVGM